MTPAERPPLRAARELGRGVLLALVAVGILLLALHPELLDPVRIKAAVARYPAAPLVFLALHVVASLIFFPRTLLAIAAGALFGAFWGTLWAALGSVLGASAGFLFARYVAGGRLNL